MRACRDMYTETQSCLGVGFQSNVPECTNRGCGTRGSSSTAITRIIPDMNFTCTGTVTKWKAAGSFDNANNVNAFLGIWKQNSTQAGSYDRVAKIELGTCGSGELVMVTGNVYECTLPVDLRVPVQPGDIIGIEIARRNVY